MLLFIIRTWERKIFGETKNPQRYHSSIVSLVFRQPLTLFLLSQLNRLILFNPFLFICKMIQFNAPPFNICEVLSLFVWKI